jgi:cytochrome P450
MSEPEIAADVFGEFQRAYSRTPLQDPYPEFAALRRLAPVHRQTPASVQAIALGGKPPPAIFNVVSHAAVARVLLDSEAFSSSVYARTMGLVMGHTILEMDEPEHGPHRALLQHAFTKRALARLDADLVRPAVRDLVDRFAGRGRADLVRELAWPFPVAVIGEMLGLPPEDRPRFHRLAVELLLIGFDPERGLAASRALREYLAAILERRRREPGEDLVSALVEANLSGARLDDEAIFAFLRLLLPAGAETTYRATSNLLFGLLSNPDQLDAVRADRSLVPQAIEEGLRWESPITWIVRTAARDTELEGVAIPRGSWISVLIGSANRDETRYEEPDRFDLFRPQRPHQSFGFGVHRCLGMHLARLEMRVALEEVLDRLAELRFDPSARDLHVGGTVLRAPPALPVVFRPATSP